MSRLYTIGFTKKNALQFFNSLKRNNIKTLIDIRLNNNSQLAGFTKKDDLNYFLSEICGIKYIHTTDLAPTERILKDYKDKVTDWKMYESAFIDLIEKRRIEKLFTISELDDACLLCSEPTVDNCHRRLVAEYLSKKFPEIKIIHL